MRITVLGGAGKMGCVSVQDLANDPRVDVVTIADVDTVQAQIVADYINSPKITIKPVNPAASDMFGRGCQRNNPAYQPGCDGSLPGSWRSLHRYGRSFLYNP